MKPYRKLKDQALYCLQKYPLTRNCDTKLTNAIWVEFYPSKLRNVEGEWLLPLLSRYDMPSQDAVSRIRRKIQESGQYIPTDDKVLLKRRIRAEQVKGYMLS